MIQLSEYATRVVDRLTMMGNWLTVVVSIRNLQISWRLYKRTNGKIHLVNTVQVGVLMIHRFLYGIIPLFEISTCAYFPLLISLWHISYILFYVIMFMRLLILEERRTIWLWVVGISLILLRFADWPYELTFHQIQLQYATLAPEVGATCLATWGNGVLILNFVSDSLANLFLSGMFVRRLFLHVRQTKANVSRQQQLIEYIARKSLVCLILTFVVNLAMNLLKITSFIGDRSDAFTVYFELIESTLLVEALRVENRPSDGPIKAICENCGMVLDPLSRSDEHPRQQQVNHHLSKNNYYSGYAPKPSNTRNENPTESILQDIAMFDTGSYVEDMKQPLSPPGRQLNPSFQSITNERLVQSPPPAAPTPTSTSGNMTYVPSPHPPSSQQPHYLTQHPEWSNNDYRMF